MRISQPRYQPSRRNPPESNPLLYPTQELTTHTSKLNDTPKKKKKKKKKKKRRRRKRIIIRRKSRRRSYLNVIQWHCRPQFES